MMVLDPDRCVECGSFSCSASTPERPLCFGCYEIGVKKQRAADEREERLRSIQEDLPAALLASGVAARYAAYTRASWERMRGKTWAESETRSAHGESFTLADICGEWIAGDRSENWLLMLHGAHGRGKTGLGTAMLGEALAGGFGPAHWIDAERWIDDQQWGIEKADAGRPGWRSAETVFRQALTAPLLMIDDLAATRARRFEKGANSGTWWQERVTSLLRTREMEMLPTIVTSNVPDIEDLGKINHSLPSRLRTRLLFEIAGKDLRARRRKE